MTQPQDSFNIGTPIETRKKKILSETVNLNEPKLYNFVSVDQKSKIQSKWYINNHWIVIFIFLCRPEIKFGRLSEDIILI